MWHALAAIARVGRAPTRVSDALYDAFLVVAKYFTRAYTFRSREKAAVIQKGRTL
jgi:hypothetical protein